MLAMPGGMVNVQLGGRLSRLWAAQLL